MAGVDYIKGGFVFDGDVYPHVCTVEILTHIRDELEMRDDDILVSSFAKAGTTWVQEIIWSLINGAQSANKHTASMDHVFPFMEMGGEIPGLELIEKLPEPRLIKSHLNAKFFKRALDGVCPCPRIVAVIRNPKDLFVSFYHFYKSYALYTGTWDQFFGVIKKKGTSFGDYFEHVLSWVGYKDHPKVLIVKYEDLKADPSKSIQSIADHLDVKISPEILATLVQETSFEAMKARPIERYFSSKHGVDLGNFFRKGKVGDWKELLNDDQVQYFDQQLASKFGNIGLTFETTKR